MKIKDFFIQQSSVVGLERASNNRGKKKDSLDLLVHYQIAAWEQKKEIRHERNGEGSAEASCFMEEVILIFFLGGFHFCVHFSCCTERILQWEGCRKRDFMSRDPLQSPLSTSQSVMFWRLVISSSLSQQCIHCYVWRVVVIISPLSTLQSVVSRRNVIISPLSTPQSYVLETCDHLLLFCYWRVVICSIRLKWVLSGPVLERITSVSLKPFLSFFLCMKIPKPDTE
ncbi:hypothetical protein CY35_08G032900 [Sphagnum magellanicum]|jgi:hypothetical protein|nr:hypothetical protein CY35_08G032900 [Sphagnum magellanicum]